jgi:hypothetical protein
MLSEQAHRMELKTIHPSGAEEWSCPECGRHFIAQWEPKFRRVILNQGEEQVNHVGQGMMNVQVESLDRHAEDDLGEDPELGDVWKRWLDKMDFDSKDHKD